MILRFLCVVAFAVLLAAPAWAQPTAVDLAADAKAHYDRGEWQDALRLFEEAERIAHSPVLVLYTARCLRNLDRLIRAQELFMQVASEALPGDAPKPFQRAVSEAKDDLAALNGRIPRLVIDRSGAPSDWAVSIDGAPTTETRVAVDPGKHVVLAVSGGQERFRKEVSVTEGASVTVKVMPSASAPPSPALPGLPTPSPDPDQAADPDGFPVAPGIILTSVGAVAVGVGVALRVVALNKVSDIKERCVGGSCLREDEAELDSAVTFQNTSTGLFIAGGVLAAAGVVLLVVSLTDEADATSLHVGPSRFTLVGRF